MTSNFDVHLFQTREGKWQARVEGGDKRRYTGAHFVISNCLAEAASMITRRLE